MIDPTGLPAADRQSTPLTTSIAIVTQVPDVIDPAGGTKKNMPVTI